MQELRLKEELAGRRVEAAEAQIETTSSPAPRQRTLRGESTVVGKGLFTGHAVRARLRPAEPDTGVVFVRVDLDDEPEVRAHIDNVIERPRRTTLQVDGAEVEMVEHCLSAMAGLGVDNVVIEIDASELPAGDGSAQMWVDAVHSAGIVEQEAPRRPIIITEPISVRQGDASVTALPNGGGPIDLLYDLDYGPDSLLGRQAHAFTLDEQSYEHSIAPARTYALYDEAMLMRQRGMFEHVSPRDMLVIGESGPIENEFRFNDEPVRHKVLDLLGDLSLVGRPIRGRIVATKSGHALNQRLAQAIADLVRGAEPAEGVVLNQRGVDPAMNIKQILRMLPHRYPMVLVDRVLEIESDRRAIGVKNVSINEPFFQGHYPASPIMPGVLIVEAMSQLAGLMLSRKLERTGKVAVLLSLEGVKLRRPVTPGDQLTLKAEAVRATSRFGDVRCKAYVEDRLVAEAQVKFMMVDAEQD